MTQLKAKHCFNSTKCFRAPSPTSHRNGKRKWGKRQRQLLKKAIADEMRNYSESNIE